MGHDVIPLARIYAHNFTEFMDRLNGSAAAIGEVPVLDTVADLYRTSIQHVESVRELVEHVTEMLSVENKIDELNRTILQLWSPRRFFNQTSFLDIIVEKQKELVSLLKNIFVKAGKMSEHKDGNPFINAISSSTISRFVDTQYWEVQLIQEAVVLFKYQTCMREAQDIDFILYKVTPVIMAIILVVGMTGNGLLLTIFVKHKETRTIANSMLINLTVVDFISLSVILVLDYLRLVTPWYQGWLGCKIFLFLSFLLSSVSTYSVAMISVQRFVAVRQLPSLAWCHQSQKTKYVLTATVWGIGCIVSVPNAVIAVYDSETETCLKNSPPYFTDTVTLITFCAVPLIITAVFSGLTACRIRQSAREIPGEATGQQQLQHSRMVSSTVLFALTVIFVFSYAPDFLLNFLFFQVGITMTSETYTWVNMVTYHLRFVNCCLNPIVLFVLSKRYRGYIKRCCGQRGVQTVMRVEAAQTPL